MPLIIYDAALHTWCDVAIGEILIRIYENLMLHSYIQEDNCQLTRVIDGSEVVDESERENLLAMEANKCLLKKHSLIIEKSSQILSFWHRFFQ